MKQKKIATPQPEGAELSYIDEGDQVNEPIK